MDEPQTAEAINSPQTGRVNIVPTVRISDVATVKAPERSAALAEIKDCSLSLKLSREKMIAAIRDARQVPVQFQDALLALVDAIPEKHDLLRLDFIFHRHGDGANFSGTVKEL